jgi:hypothetical protein
VVLVGAVTLLALKEFFHAAGASRGLAVDHGWAFPNGAAFMSVVVYGLCATLAWKRVPQARSGWRLAMVAFLSAIVLSSVTGHVYTGARWTTDVAAGGLLGIGWLAMGIGLSTVFADRRDELRDEVSSERPGPP